MAEFQKAAKTTDLKEGKIKLAHVAGEEIALYKIGEQVFATNNLCTHESCELDQNNIIEGDEVECTCHGSKFNIKTGENIAPPAAGPLPVYKTKVDGDDVYVEID